MAVKYLEVKRFAGIADADKEGLRSSYLFGRSIDYRTDPTKLTILPRTTKSSGSVVVDLPMIGERYSTDMYVYGNAGNIYRKSSSDAWSDLRTVVSSTGNGLKYFGEDDYLYYTSDKVIGRYGPMSGTKAFADDFLGAEGGIPANTHSIDLEASSSMYCTAADSAELSEAGDMSLEICGQSESIPTSGNSMVLMSKWDDENNDRSYIFELYAAAGIFGGGGDGALTIAANTTQAPVDSACTGTAAATTLTATNASFATGDKILIHQTRGTNAGQWEMNEIGGYTAGTITLTSALTNTYTSKSQVIVMPQYSGVTVSSAKTWTAKSWNGTVGGILSFLCSGTTTVTGAIRSNGSTGGTSGVGGTGGGATGGGFYGGNAKSAADGEIAIQGEGSAGAGAASSAANGNGGGGATSSGNYAGGGGGGGNGASGSTGVAEGGPPGAGGSTAGSADLTTMVFGGGGGGGIRNTDNYAGAGGSGGGMIMVFSTTTTITGAISVNGGGGGTGVSGNGGGGAGGSVLIKSQTATLGTGLITATGGTAYTGSQGEGGPGAVGRIHLDYYTSYTGTTSPTLDVTQDDTLVNNLTYQLRFGVSDDGEAEEYLTKSLPATPTLAQWYRYGVTWDASESTANFYVGGSNIGSVEGTMTSQDDNDTLFALGCSFDSSGDDENHWDGKLDDGRVWSDIRTDGEMDSFKEVELSGAEAGLVAYWEVDNSTADSSANSNTLSLVNTPTYDAEDVPFSSPTTRNDEDQELETTGNTYTLAVAIDEGATHRQAFVPEKDPQKSVEIHIAAVGTGDWTLTVHDGLNREIASKTVVNADLNTNDFEFVFASVWRPVLGATYHFHVTSTVADGTVTTTTNIDLNTVDFHTYYQFLVEDSYHPVERILNKLAIGNERYVATWDGITYEPHKLTLPSGYNIRALGTWREYLAIGVTRGNTLTDRDLGVIFFWDGISDTYNFYADVPEGGINAILSGDPLLFVAGYSGDLMKYSGGIPRKILRFPNMTNTKIMEVYPGGMAMWRALSHIGVAGDSDSTTIEKGVWAYGSLNERIEETLSFDYPTSTGVTTGTGLDIGMVFPMGSSLFIGFKNGSSYGVDEVAPDNPPFAEAVYESLITDGGKIWAKKTSNFIRGYFSKIVSGDAMTLKYKIDRDSSWIEGATNANKGYAAVADVNEARMAMPSTGNRFNEFQFGIKLETTNTTSPEFYGIGVEMDDTVEEKRT